MDIIKKFNELALAIAREAYGEEHAAHLKAVAESLPVELKALGYLNDILHHGAYTENMLRELLPAWIVDRILVLTPKASDNFDDYILKVAGAGKDIKTVKAAALREKLSYVSGAENEVYRLAIRLLGEEP